MTLRGAGRLQLALVLAGAVAAGACGSSDRPGPPADTAPPPPVAAVPPAPVDIEMRNVRLHLAPGILLAVARLRGEMVSVVSNQPPVFDDSRSYVLQVHAAEVDMDVSSLGRLMNDHIFAYEDAPLSKITVSEVEGRLQMKGTLHKGVPLPFSTVARVDPAPGGRIRLRTEKVGALGIPVTGLLHLLHLELDELVALERRRGIRIEGDDILLTPGQVLPPPEMRGHIAETKIGDGLLRLTFASPNSRVVKPLRPPQPTAPGYIYFSGGSIRFGKLTMADADLQLIDADGRDPFDFSPAEYQRQLVAGYSKNTVSGGLETYMPDLDDVKATGRGLRPPR